RVAGATTTLAGPYSDMAGRPFLLGTGFGGVGARGARPAVVDLIGARGGPGDRGRLLGGVDHFVRCIVRTGACPPQYVLGSWSRPLKRGRQPCRNWSMSATRSPTGCSPVRACRNRPSRRVLLFPVPPPATVTTVEGSRWSAPPAPMSKRPP